MSFSAPGDVLRNSIWLKSSLKHEKANKWSDGGLLCPLEKEGTPKIPTDPKGKLI